MNRDDGIIAIIVAVIGGVIGGIIWLIVHQIAVTDECAAKGGMMIRAGNGYVCAKVEVIK